MLLATVAWVGSLSTVIFLGLRRLRILRAPEKLDAAEIDMDASRVGGYATPGGSGHGGLALVFEPPVRS